MNKEEFQKIEKLYHYTSIDSALKILFYNSLKFGELKRMNDINEAYRNVFYPQGINLEMVNEELAKYRQISLTRDNSPRRGYYIPAMWGHYAQKGMGVCLVFDKKELLSALTSDMKSGDIEYEDNYDGSILIQNQDIEVFFERYMKELFFIKTSDWSYEQEFRILTKTDSLKPLYLPLKNSIIAIIMNYAEDVDYRDKVFDSLKVKLFKQIFPKIPILDLGVWGEKPNLCDERGDNWETEEANIIDMI